MDNIIKSLDTTQKKTVVIAGVVLIAGSALLLYQLSQSKTLNKDAAVTTGFQDDDSKISDLSTEETKIQEETNSGSSMSFPLRLYTRLRPLSTEEKEKKPSKTDWSERAPNSRTKTVAFEIKSSVRKGMPKQFFGIDKIFKEYIEINEIFDECVKSSLTNNVMNGNSVCVLNCGQVGSGKMNLMLGNNNNTDNTDKNSNNANGMYYLTAQLLLNQINSVSNNKLCLYVKYYEYDYSILKARDLLSDGLIECDIREDGDGNVFIQHPPAKNPETGVRERKPLTRLTVTDANQVLSYINDANNRLQAAIGAAVAEQGADTSSKSKKKKKRGGDSVNNPKLSSVFVVFELGRADENGNEPLAGLGGKIGFISLVPSNEYLIEKKKIKWGYKRDETTKSQKTANEALVALQELMDNVRTTKGDIRNVMFNKNKLTMVLREFMVNDNSEGIVIANISPIRDDIKRSINVLDFSQGLKNAGNDGE